MSSCSRRAFLGGLAAALAGCGFRPVHGPKGSAKGLRGQIEIDEPRDIAGFALAQQLESRFGLPVSPQYRLAARITVEEREIGIRPTQTITRYQVLGRVAFRLIEKGSGDVVTSGRVENFASYSATDTPFATSAAQADAQDRLMVILADQITARLLASSEDWR